MRILVEPKNALVKPVPEVLPVRRRRPRIHRRRPRSRSAEEALKRATGARGLRAILEEVATRRHVRPAVAFRHREVHRRPRGRPAEGRADARDRRRSAPLRVTPARRLRESCRIAAVPFGDASAKRERCAQYCAGHRICDRTGGCDAPVRHHQRMRESGWDLFEVMSHEHERRASRIVRPVGEVGDELFASADVESGRRLVEQDDPGIVHQCARQEHPLTFAGRKCRQPVFRQAGTPKAFEERNRARDRRRCTDATTAPTPRSGRSSRPARRSCWARGGRRAQVTRTRCAPAVCAHRNARGAGRARPRFRSSDAGTELRSAAALSCPRRWVRARPSVHRLGSPTRRRRVFVSRRSRG